MGYNPWVCGNGSFVRNGRRISIYIEAGMTPEQIEALYQYDWAVFKAERVYRDHTHVWIQRVWTKSWQRNGEIRSDKPYEHR